MVFIIPAWLFGAHVRACVPDYFIQPVARSSRLTENRQPLGARGCMFVPRMACNRVRTLGRDESTAGESFVALEEIRVLLRVHHRSIAS